MDMVEYALKIQNGVLGGQGYIPEITNDVMEVVTVQKENIVTIKNFMDKMDIKAFVYDSH